MQIKSALHSPLCQEFLTFYFQVKSLTNDVQSKNTRDFAESAVHQANMESLDSILDGWSMVRREVTGDGNCSFSAVAIHLCMAETVRDPNGRIIRRTTKFFQKI